MKTVVLLYDTSCIYEIVILNYFLKVTGKEMQFVSLDGKEITDHGRIPDSAGGSAGFCGSEGCGTAGYSGRRY